jgi:hypothetical protein
MSNTGYKNTKVLNIAEHGTKKCTHVKHKKHLLSDLISYLQIIHDTKNNFFTLNCENKCNGDDWWKRNAPSL